MLAWRNIDVTSRYQSPFSLIATPSSRPRLYTSPPGSETPPPWDTVTRYTRTLSATSPTVAGASRPATVRRVRRIVCWGLALLRGAPTDACSGHLIPTGAYVMHSSQMYRPHSEHETSVSRSGCR